MSLIGIIEIYDWKINLNKTQSNEFTFWTFHNISNASEVTQQQKLKIQSIKKKTTKLKVINFQQKVRQSALGRKTKYEQEGTKKPIII